MFRYRLHRFALMNTPLYLPVSSRSMASKTQVGFIGLGNMGKPMAKNLLKHGYPVVATDVFPESCKELQELGAQVGQKKLACLLMAAHWGKCTG